MNIEDIIEDIACTGHEAEGGDGDEGIQPRGGLAHLEAENHGGKNDYVLYPLLRPTQPNHTSKLPAVHTAIVIFAPCNCK
jgi:hypothetical protein